MNETAQNAAVEHRWSDEESRERTAALLLTLADNRRLLGIRYADCMLGSPSLETAIAAASMAQDEWGHSRLTYALLADFGGDPRRLEHGREAEEYRSMELLDRPLGSFAAFVAAALLIDTALTAQYAALQRSGYSPIRTRVQKMLEEEVLHEQFAIGWTERIAASGMREEFHRHLARMLPAVLRWFGTGEESEPLVREGIVSAGAEALRARYLLVVAPPLEDAGLATRLSLRSVGGEWRYSGTLDWSGWDPVRRRSTAGGPDADTLSRVRGDRDRSVLLE